MPLAHFSYHLARLLLRLDVYRRLPALADETIFDLAVELTLTLVVLTDFGGFDSERVLAALVVAPKTPLSARLVDSDCVVLLVI